MSQPVWLWVLAWAEAVRCCPRCAALFSSGATDPRAQVAVFSQDAPDVHGEAQQALRACLSYAKPDVWSGLLIRREKWEWE